MKSLCKCPRWLKIFGGLLLLSAMVLAYVGWDRFFREYPP